MNAQKSFERIHRREKTSWKAQRKWIHAVDKNAYRMLKCKNWRKLAKDKAVWKERIDKAKAQVGLKRHRKKKHGGTQKAPKTLANNKSITTTRTNDMKWDIY
jgi:hypothetical protein